MYNVYKETMVNGKKKVEALKSFPTYEEAERFYMERVDNDCRNSDSYYMPAYRIVQEAI